MPSESLHNSSHHCRLQTYFDLDAGFEHAEAEQMFSMIDTDHGELMYVLMLDTMTTLDISLVHLPTPAHFQSGRLLLSAPAHIWHTASLLA